MKRKTFWLLIFACNGAAAIRENAKQKNYISPFTFPPPEPPREPLRARRVRPYERIAATAPEKETLKKDLSSAMEETEKEIEETLGGPPAVEQPEKEKEEKARSKGNFLTKIMEEASRVFAMINFWYKYGK